MALKMCTDHPDRPSVAEFDGDEYCLECANLWVMGQRFDDDEDTECTASHRFGGH